MTDTLHCFKAYDIRGRVPDELNADIAYRIGRAYADYLKPQRVAVGRDVRLSSDELCDALAEGLMDGGAHVYDIGIGGTEQIYFATFHVGFDGGIMVTASHNPMDYNGMKLVREGSRPISGDSGLGEIRRLAERNDFAPAAARGSRQTLDIGNAYVKHLLSYIDASALNPLKLVVNAGNGGAGLVVDALEKHLPFEFIKVHHQPDGNFPNGIPNPLLPERRAATVEAIRASGADAGIAWDGDFDRCFLFDEKGRFIEGYYIVGLLASQLLQKEPGAKIVHDPRLTWNTVEIVRQAGGVPVMSKTGHAFMKERMRVENALYGGEMSAHHYFRDFAYCDSGMIPWLLVAERMSASGKPLSALVDERIEAYPCSGEINFRVAETRSAIGAILAAYERQGGTVDYTDGVSVDFADWRFNLRGSNTEPVLRLNVETRGDFAAMERRTAELRDRILALGGEPA